MEYVQQASTYLDPRRVCSAEVNIHVKAVPWPRAGALTLGCNNDEL